MEDPEVGAIYKGRVTRLMNFGAFVEIAPGKEGLVHISKLDDRRVEHVEDVVAVGDPIYVMVTDIDQQGRINLSRKDRCGGHRQKACGNETASNPFTVCLPPPFGGGRFFVCGAKSYFFRGRPGKNPQLFAAEAAKDFLPKILQSFCECGTIKNKYPAMRKRGRPRRCRGSCC